MRREVVVKGEKILNGLGYRVNGRGRKDVVSLLLRNFVLKRNRKIE